VAAALSIDVHRLRMIQLYLAASHHVSASTSASDDLPDPEHPDSPEGSPEYLCARTEMIDLLRKAVAELPERQREVIRLYYTDEMTMKEVGKRLSVNESRASQIHRVAINFVGEQLRASGIRSVA